MAIPEILITAGVVAVLASVAGGGLKGFGVEVPLLASVRRQVGLLLVGVVLVGLGLYSAWLPQGAAETAGAASEQADAAGPLADNAASPAAPAPAAADLTAGGATRARPEVPNIVDLPFPVARQFLIQNSWSPINSASTPMANADRLGMRAQEVWDAGYREAVACSGTGSAPCTFRYRHPTGAILEVVAVGEDLKQAIVNDARILDCAANPKPDGCAW